jgi:hypothetical protein
MKHINTNPNVESRQGTHVKQHPPTQVGDEVIVTKKKGGIT